MGTNDLPKAPQQPASQRAFANVIVRAQSGNSVMQPGTRITPENVKSYLPSEAALNETADRLRELGFSIELVAPTHVSISAETSLFEQVFQAKLAADVYPLLYNQKSQGGYVHFKSDRPLVVPESLSKLVEAIDLAKPISLHTGARPPLSYYHLEVPDDIARGMDATKVHRRGITGNGIVIASVDSGFMTPFHPYYLSHGYSIDPVDPYPGGDPSDDAIGHGTGVLSCALAVAPGARLKVYKANAGFWTEAFSRAAMARPHIITNSWGLRDGDFDWALQLAINLAVADGIVVLFAVGNGQKVGWPSSEPAVISVGGAYLSDDMSITASNCAASGMTEHNPGRQCPDVCGLVGMEPNGIYIAMPTQPRSWFDQQYAGRSFPDGDETCADDGWLVASYTSVAAPMVAGVCALMMEHDPTLRWNPARVRTALQKSCLDVIHGSSGSGERAGPGVDKATGYGLVQAYKAVFDSERSTESDVRREAAVSLLTR